MPTISHRLRLVLLSALMLFVELALIRWTGANVIYLSYFSNFVLLGSFLGIGIGFLRAKAPQDLFPYAPIALALFVAFVLLLPVQIDRSGSEYIFFGKLGVTGLPAWLMLPVIFLAVAGIMAMIGEGVARTFVRFEPLEAYRLDITGSILGIVGFSVLSFTWAPPVAWGAVVASLFGVLLFSQMRRVHLVSLVGIVLMLGAESLTPELSWSPYYKVRVAPDAGGEPVTHIEVNGIPHQEMSSVDHRREHNPVYFIPYERTALASLDNVLIVGAGAGSDVAIALAQGAGEVDAVEIDPTLQSIGAERHPDRPYQDPRVDVVIDDARAFLERTDRRYDLIVFALPDSLTLIAGQSSLRLESYLFTVEAMDAAREHLKPGGAFSMYNYYRESWLVDRLAATLDRVYGHAPCVDNLGTEGELAALTVAPNAATMRCRATWSATGSPSPATDDHPFVYLRTRSIPGFYLAALTLILGASAVLIRAVSGPLRPMAGYLDLFFMGSAFLLLETKSVTQFALLFGTTWFVNALVFAGVLVSVLAAIEVTRRWRIRRAAYLYTALLAAVVLAWFVPPGALLALDAVPRFAIAGVLAFAPIFLANLVFANRFHDVEASHIAFGANLLGAMVGGVLEYLALITGYQALLLLVALLYGLAFLVSPGTRPAVAGAVGLLIGRS